MVADHLKTSGFISSSALFGFTLSSFVLTRQQSDAYYILWMLCSDTEF